jgi:hypothetical protein
MPGNESAFRGFYERTVTRLGDAKFRKRLCEPWTSEVMPEIWTDYVVTENFRASFFESLSFALSTFKRMRSIARSIWERVPFSDEALTEPETLGKEFGRYLRDEGWCKDDWIR